MKTGPNRLNGVWTVTVLELKQKRKVLYVKAMEKRLTTSDQTVQVRLLTVRLVLLVAQQIGSANLSVVEMLKRHF
jgi:hypothetical protein